MAILTEVLAQFTDEFLDNIAESVHGYGWQHSGTLMDFSEALGILQNLLGELREADDQGIVDSMPRSLQQSIKQNLENVYSYATQICNGNNRVADFVTYIDRLHLDLWNGGFRYHGKRLLGYESKYRQASKLAQQAEKAREYLATVQQIVENLQNLADQANQIVSVVGEHRNVAESRVQEIQNLLPQANHLQNTLQMILNEIENFRNSAKESSTAAEASANNAAVYEKRIQQFIEKVDANEKRLTQVVKSTNEAVEEVRNQFTKFQQEKQAEVEEFLLQLHEIEKDIREKLAKATGVTLFETFEIRHKQIWGHIVWAFVAILTFAGGIWYLRDLLLRENAIDVAFFIRLGLAIPIAVIVGFALRQYALERRLKEEYRYKSTISLSLEAYRNLVEQAVEKLTPEEKIRFAEFLINSISRIFESPTDKVFGEARGLPQRNLRHLRELLEIIKQVTDTVDTK